MRPIPEGPHKNDPVRLGGPSRWTARLWTCAELVQQMESLPFGVYEGANRYDTDDEHVLHVWRDGQSWDIRWPRRSPEAET